MAAPSVDVRGAQMFARYAHAPNALGYCGPPLGATLRHGSIEQIRAAAATFTGAWPYLQVLARLTGIPDPLDHRLVESYWLGGGIAADLDPTTFLTELLTIIGPQAGHYWSHLNTNLAAEAAPNHNFHVFAVYPWTRLLGQGLDQHPLTILDNCRITWGKVLSVDTTTAKVCARQLAWDGQGLALTTPVVRNVEIDAEENIGPPALTPCQHVAIHWGRVCDVLTPRQVDRLAQSTHRQIRVTNRRLARQRR
ncbi:DUF6390 family protein [Mycobacterium sp.]|uniref:DUF6390 family protein n=1 Tax=Mycobacterium sp. TaxID=1785 RepID=UPI00127BABBB|nr:DUF6390 family protein [Mycobacterium sp.]KAA8957069.1 MAG: hypothetical protein F6Q13_16660 [Mycobacterium sp.]